ncbi:MAG: S-layer homology domain-containing protein, partial [Phormidesmis sp.]
MSPILRLSIKVTCTLVAGLSIPLTMPSIFSGTGYANAQSQSASFTDVSTDYWATDYIEGLAQLDVISGFGDGTFKPNDPVTRAQFAAILRQSFLQSQPTTAQSFRDVPANYWAANAISAARSAGFLSGYPDNTFKPNDRIVRVQALVSLANGLKYPASNSQSLSNYKDAAAVPAYARASTAAAAQANLVVSYPALDQISPNRAASRAEVAAFVYQALVKSGRAEPIAMKMPKDWQLEPIATISAKVGPMSFDQTGQRLGAIADLGNNVQLWD